MKYSHTALRVLKSRYLSVLKKCALINAGLFFLAAPAMADMNIGDFDDLMNEWDYLTGRDCVFNLIEDLTANQNIEEPIAPDTTAITIHGNGHDINGNGYGGFRLYDHVLFTVNEAGNKNDINSRGWYGFKSTWGGAINGRVKIFNSVFRENTASHGGGAIVVNGASSIFNSFFLQNKTNGEGGAIYNQTGASISNSIFRGNSANNTGGAIFTIASLTISDSIFEGNSSGKEGGAIWLGYHYPLNIIADKKDTIFTGNTANDVSNALFIAMEENVNLNAGDGRIVFNDGIDGEVYDGRINNTININKDGIKKADGSDAPTNGVVEFNNLVKNNNINLYDGTLKLGTYSGGTVLGKEVAASEGNFSENVEFKALGGTLDIGTQQVEVKDATFDSGSTLAVTVNPDKHGSLSAQNLSVKDGATLKATLAQGLVDRSTGSKTFALVSADKWTEATADKNGDNFMLAQDNNMYKFEKTDVAGEYLVTLAKTAEEVSQETGGTTNNANTARAWIDGGAFAKGSREKELADKLAGLAQNNAQAFNNALTALAPEVAPAVRTQAVDNSNQIFNAVSSRLSSGSVSSALDGMASGDSLLDGGATWVQMLVNKAEFDGNHKAHGFDSKTAGVAMGAEKQISDTTKAGVGYGYTNGEVDAFMRDIDVDTHTVFAYGEYKPNNWFVNGIASYSFADYDESKNVAGSHYKAKYDTENLGLQIMGGHDTVWGRASITPAVGLRYNHIMRDAYTDTAGQHVSDDAMDMLTAVMEAKLYKDFQTCGGTWWRPEARLALAYDLISDEENAVVGLSNGSSYLIEGERLDRLSVEAGLGLTIDVNEHVEVSAGYEGRFREDYQDHTGMLKAKYKF